MRFLSAGAVALLLGMTGCADDQLRQAAAARKAAQSLCRIDFPKEVGRLTARADCLGKANEDFADNGGPNPDLLRLFSAKMRLLAVQGDAHEISLDDYNIKVAELAVRFGDEARDRAMQDAEASNERAQAMNERLAAIRAAFPPPSQPVYPAQYQMPQVSQPINTRCTTSGFGGLATTNCSTY